MNPYFHATNVAIVATAAVYYGVIGLVFASCAVALLIAAVEFLMTGRE